MYGDVEVQGILLDGLPVRLSTFGHVIICDDIYIRVECLRMNLDPAKSTNDEFYKQAKFVLFLAVRPPIKLSLTVCRQEIYIFLSR